MRENGGKMMKLYIGTVKINDYREKSLLKKNTRIVFNLDQNQFYMSENEESQDQYDDDSDIPEDS